MLLTLNCSWFVIIADSMWSTAVHISFGYTHRRNLKVCAPTENFEKEGKIWHFIGRLTAKTLSASGVRSLTPWPHALTILPPNLATLATPLYDRINCLGFSDRRSDFINFDWATNKIRSRSPIWLYQFLRSFRWPIWPYHRLVHTDPQHV